MKAFFVFSGQGTQTVGMGQYLYRGSSSARAVFDEADAILGRKLSRIMFEGPEAELTANVNSQPAIYTMSCAALVAFREKFPGFTPEACAGLSLGEYAALYAGGAFSFAEGLELLQKRAELMDHACRETSGGMASVLGGDRDIIEKVCAECDIDVANYNSPGQIVISGEKQKLAAAVDSLKAHGMRKVLVLNVAGAFHSRLMASAGEGLKKELATAPMEMPVIPVYQNFSATPAKNLDELKSNLASQVAGSVRWEGCVRAMAALGCDTMIEFGPGTVLTGLLRRTLPEIRGVNINCADALAAFEI